MSTKIDHAIFQLTNHPFTFQKYKGICSKSVDNLKKITKYEVISIEGIDTESEKFKTLAEIIETDLNITDKKQN